MTLRHLALGAAVLLALAACTSAPAPVVAPVVVSADDLQGSTVEVPLNSMLVINTGDLDVDSYTAEVAVALDGQRGVAGSDAAGRVHPLENRPPGGRGGDERRKLVRDLPLGVHEWGKHRCDRRDSAHLPNVAPAGILARGLASR